MVFAAEEINFLMHRKMQSIFLLLRSSNIEITNFECSENTGIFLNSKSKLINLTVIFYKLL